MFTMATANTLTVVRKYVIICMEYCRSIKYMIDKNMIPWEIKTANQILLLPYKICVIVLCSAFNHSLIFLLSGQ